MESGDPLVSVVIPSFNRPRALLEAISSVDKQAYSAIEVVVVDDASEEPVAQVLAETTQSFSCSVTTVRHDKNKGASAARNTGIDNSQGELIAFLDDDDVWKPQKIAKQVDRFLSVGGHVGVVYTGMEFVDEREQSVRTHVEAIEGDVTKELLRRNFVGSFSTVMVRSEAIKKTGGLDERFPCWQDIEWYIRLSTDWEFASVPEPLVKMRQQEGDHISDDFEQIRETALSLFVEKYRSLARSYGWWFEREFCGWVEFRVGAYNALRTGHYSEARRHLLKSIWYYPVEWRFWVYTLVAMGGESTYQVAMRIAN